MGWDFCDKWTKRTDAVAAALSRSVVVAKKQIRGGECWAVVKYNGTNEIIVVLTEKNGRSWGYKVLGECESPYYWNCPVAFLDLAPVRNEEWRRGVLALVAQTAVTV